MRQKKTKTTSRLLKLTDAQDGQIVYINPGQVAALKEHKKQYIDPNSVSSYTGTSYDMIHPDALCSIHLHSGYRFQVREHIAIVTAMLKGEDPAPAEVIFGTD